MALTQEEAQKALEYIVGQLQKKADMYKGIPESKVRYVKNQKSSSAYAEERGENDEK